MSTITGCEAGVPYKCIMFLGSPLFFLTYMSEFHITSYVMSMSLRHCWASQPVCNIMSYGKPAAKWPPCSLGKFSSQRLAMTWRKMMCKSSHYTSREACESWKCDPLRCAWLTIFSLQCVYRNSKQSRYSSISFRNFLGTSLDRENWYSSIYSHWPPVRPRHQVKRVCDTSM